MITGDDMLFSLAARNDAFNAANDYLHNNRVRLKRSDYMAIINMGEPSYRQRLYVYDRNGHIYIGAYCVAHGSGSSNPKDFAYATSFSNVNNSHKSSLGAMMTGDIYVGKHGKSLRLVGLEKGINDNVAKRSIVIHPADYVDDDFILDSGRAGQSWGCPAISNNDAKVLIPLLAGGCYVYIYYPKP